MKLRDLFKRNLKETVPAWLADARSKAEVSFTKRPAEPKAYYSKEVICQNCEQKTKQYRHGYTADGELWKGHECMCNGWQCGRCGTLNQPQQECCR